MWPKNFWIQALWNGHFWPPLVQASSDLQMNRASYPQFIANVGRMTIR